MIQNGFKQPQQPSRSVEIIGSGAIRFPITLPRRYILYRFHDVCENKTGRHVTLTTLNLRGIRTMELTPMRSRNFKDFARQEMSPTDPQ